METLKNIAGKLPHVPGVYVFKNAHGKILYIGKARDLRRRVTQYFLRDDAVGAKTPVLMSQVHSLTTITTDNEFDALLLEAKLIRGHLPKYNVIARDDKSPLYIAITCETLPRILWLRKTSLSLYSEASFFGPFQSGKVIRVIMRQLRRIVPYCTQKQRNGKPCFYTHLGLCSPCPSAITNTKQTIIYKNNIRKIMAILSGKSLTLLHTLEREMQNYARINQFENAHIIKKQMEGLRQLQERHFDPTIYMQNASFTDDIHKEEIQSLQRALQLSPIHRIECIDISNIQGAYSTGSLVVFIDGEARRGEYRRFKIRTKEAPNDFAMIAEVVQRRFNHSEWPMPDLLVIDGGKGQVAAAAAILSEVEGSFPVIGLAKRFEEIIIRDQTLRLPRDNKGLQLLMRIRDESHRFALKYHRMLREKAFL